MLAQRRAKIVATIGPSTESHENLKQAICAGMNVARLNFSHGEHAQHLKVIQSLRKLSEELRAPVSILQDLQGPKIRVGKFEKGSIILNEGDEVIVSSEFTLGREGEIPSDFKEIHEVCSNGTKILLDDGLLELSVLFVEGTQVHCKVIFGGELKNRKGMNIPGAFLPVDCLTEKDIIDLEFGLSQRVDYVAMSFVRRASDIKKLRQIIQEKSPSTKIVAKIEMLEAIENLEEIIAVSDAVMVARGDLAVEVGQTHLPGLQKRIIRLCNKMSRPVITATQMLDSMVSHPRPTRAEVTDVANAIMDGSDATMLSAESASGKYPFKCIQTMHEIICEVEATETNYYKINIQEEFSEVPQSIGASACLTAQKLNASAIVCLTTTGKTAALISAFRPQCRLIAITHIEETLSKLELIWGIQTFKIKPYRSTDEAMFQIEDILLKYGLVKTGDRVVLTLGVPVVDQAKTNSMRVYTIERELDKSLSDSLPLRCR